MKKLLLLLTHFHPVVADEWGLSDFRSRNCLQIARYDLYIHTGMNYQELDSMLRKDEVLDHPAVFSWLAKRVSYPSTVKAGKYEIRERNESS